LWFWRPSEKVVCWFTMLICCVHNSVLSLLIFPYFNLLFFMLSNRKHSGWGWLRKWGGFEHRQMI
jgi:hypothetical protein